MEGAVKRPACVATRLRSQQRPWVPSFEARGRKGVVRMYALQKSRRLTVALLPLALILATGIHDAAGQQGGQAPAPGLGGLTPPRMGGPTPPGLNAPAVPTAPSINGQAVTPSPRMELPQPGQEPPRVPYPSPAPGSGSQTDRGTPGSRKVEGPERQPATSVPEARSPIEQVFFGGQLPGLSRDLRQFGYDLFREPSSTFAPVADVPVGPDYILGPGDVIQAYLWGMVDNVLTLPVNRRGEIFVPKIGTLPVWGMPLGEVRHLIHDQLSRQFSGFRMSLHLSELRSVQIFVVGEVGRPGVYTVSSLSTVLNALFPAGGPSKQGSLRTIQLRRNNHPVGTLDLYDFLLRGDRARDFRLESGDTIFVPPIGPVVGVGGNIRRPAIYELKGATRIGDLLKMAGGLTPTGYLQRVQIERVKAHTEKVVMDFPLAEVDSAIDSKANLLIEDGDLVKIFSIDSRIYNAVFLEGFVRRPGEYELKGGMRLGDLLKPSEVLPEAYLERVEVIRTKPDLTREVLATDVRKLWRGDLSQELTLEPADHIVVNSEARPLGAVTLQGEVKRPGVYSIVRGERLSSVLERAGGFTENAYLKGVLFIRERVKKQQQQELDRFVKTQEEALLQEAARVTAGSLELASGQQQESTLLQQSLQRRKELLDILKTKAVLGRVVVGLDSLDRFTGSPSDILLEDGDTLTIPERPSSVLVIGSVRNQTAVVYEAGKDVEYYLNRAGGLSKDADKGELHVVKADGSAMAGFLKLRKIEPGDIIVAPPKMEAKVRTMPAVRDIATILGQFALTLGVFVAAF